jgi:hypothetical protein
MELQLRLTTLGELDFESWSYHPAAFQELLERLSQYPSVVILSGDVHYGYSNVMEYWNDRPPASSYSVFAQFCSSAARNAANLTEGTAVSSAVAAFVLPRSAVPGGDPGFKLLTLPESVYFGWGNAANWYGTTHVPSQLTGPSPNWQYRIRFGLDMREPEDRNLPAVTAASSSAAGLATLQYVLLWMGAERVVVGADNICLIDFRLVTSGLLVCQDFHWTYGFDDPLTAPPCKARTRHELPLTIPADPPKPWP